MTKKIAIIQLLRTGDIIQTCQAVANYGQDLANTELTLVARKKFAEPIMFLINKYFSKVVLIDTSVFDKTNFSSSKNELVNQVQPLLKNHYDLVINLSFSTSSEYLCALMKSNNKLGLYRNKNGRIVATDNWTQYIFSTVMNGTLNPFNLVDIFSYIVGGKSIQIKQQYHSKNKSIYIHPFSSHHKKRWSVEKWQNVLLELCKSFNDYNFFIVGSENEKNQASEIINFDKLQNFKSRIFNLAGEPLEDIYEELMFAKLFIGHDSMVGHLASFANVPTLTISLGMVRPSETTPYGKKSVNLAPQISCFPCRVETSCDSLPCHSEITVNAITEFAQSMIKNDINDVYLKNFAHKFACVCYYPNQETELQILTKFSNQDSLEETFKNYYSLIWSYYFRNENLNITFPKLNNKNLDELKNYLLGVQNLYELYNFAQRFTANIILEMESGKVTPEVYKTFINRLNEVDQLAQVNKNTFPMLAPIIDYFQVSRMNIPGETLIDMLGNTLVSLKDAENLCAVLYDLVEKTLLNAQIPLDNKVNNV
jgi:ADP-heptose:LPS heptosyltransferase